MLRVCQKTVTLALLIFLLGTVALPSARAGEVIDRIVATVNGHIILQSDWNDALRYEALLSGRAMSLFTEDERRVLAVPIGGASRTEVAREIAPCSRRLLEVSPADPPRTLRRQFRLHAWYVPDFRNSPTAALRRTGHEVGTSWFTRPETRSWRSVTA